MLPTLTNLAALARDIAMDIDPLSTILERNKIDQATWDRVQRDQPFQTMLQDYIREWNSAGNSRARIKVKSLSAIEMLLEDIVKAIADASIPLNQRVEAFRQLGRYGELEGKQEIGGGGPGSGVNITINIGQNTPPLTIEAKPVVMEEVDG